MKNIEFKWENDGWMDESRFTLKFLLVLYYNFFISMPFLPSYLFFVADMLSSREEIVMLDVERKEVNLCDKIFP